MKAEKEEKAEEEGGLEKKNNVESGQVQEELGCFQNHRQNCITQIHPSEDTEDANKSGPHIMSPVGSGNQLLEC